MRTRNWAIVSLVLIGALFVLVALVGVAVERANHTTGSRQHELVYGIDHIEVLRAAREVQKRASSYRQDPDWHNVPPGSFRYPDPSDPSIPESIKKLGLSTIAVERECVRLEFGGATAHYGLRAYPEGTQGEGLRELIPGLWYYSDDGRVPQP
jgi:hypothetical protein